MILLGLAAIVWFALHVGVAGTRLRDRLVLRLGEGGFRGAFSLASLASLVALAFAYRVAPLDPIWIAPAWLGWLVVAAMLVACVLLVGSVAAPNPTAVGGEKVTAPGGITLVTRHPMLWAFAIWSVVHILGNGDLASLLFFGAFAATALAGMPSLDAKLARRDPARWARIAQTTSIVPGAALWAGRARLGWRELGVVAPVGGLVLWALLLGAHPHVIGVSRCRPVSGAGGLWGEPVDDAEMRRRVARKRHADIRDVAGAVLNGREPGRRVAATDAVSRELYSVRRFQGARLPP